MDSFLGDIKKKTKQTDNKTTCYKHAIFESLNNTRQHASSAVIYIPFAAGVLVTDKVLTVLVDGVVGEMHAHILLTLVRQEKTDIYHR